MKINITSPSFDEQELLLLKQCLDSKWVTQGEFTQQFESLFKQRHDVQYAFATTSCTAALHMAMVALEIKPDDEVIVPAFTWVTSAHCVEYVGAKVVFVDIEPDTFNIDPAALEAAITPKTKAIVVVHLFGLAAKMQEIMEIAKKYNLAVVEDAACATGTNYDGKPVGGIGDIGCFSFHPRKVITTGEGGMVTTNNPKLAERIKILRNHGATANPNIDTSKPYYMGNFDHLGFNLRFSDIQAAIGVAQMAKLDKLLADRLACARQYDLLLSSVSELTIPQMPSQCGHSYQSYVVCLLVGGIDRRNLLMEALATEGIQSRPGTHAVHRLGYYKNKYGINSTSYPYASKSEDLSITLPIFPGMTDLDQQKVVNILKAALST
ncbi:DegT/DnrJ/EryC1/StrS family aminotransferase [Pseudanabaena sp. ABRG5-3]|uniref:DegT/DnrJ/EryC1/StrS family aminotransferase n=1 Tax=Pseudanabaena sp. ABRG5-3 TaxID=685565 RepID=UPI000DC6F3CE|nr:DegT/DnrJ/EryC1/StrS family aminotransferase [Pseudanabaena sp. ABRG5-3]BBC22728.1 DegT/DnrJ/EryC1/StrS aminotransferase [Pseudanabaena sp. ABRG5-3]